MNKDAQNKQEGVPSNVKSIFDVPTAPATVIIANLVSTDKAAARQAAEVAVVHPTVKQASASIVEVTVWLTSPN